MNEFLQVFQVLAFFAGVFLALLISIILVICVLEMIEDEFGDK